MSGEIDQLGHDRAIAALSWWLDAGVDSAVSELPRNWLKAPSPGSDDRIGAIPARAPAAQPEGRAEPPAIALPGDYAAFRAHLESGPGLPLDRPGARRIAPRGNPGAQLMIMADLPGQDEADAGSPIGGDAWLLGQKMLAAIGIAPDDAYLSALGCFHLVGARPGEAELRDCGRIARDHVRLVAPGRLLLFGDAPARALLGEPLARARGRVHRVEGVRAVATFHPRWLLNRPGDKALAWRDLLLLMGDDE